MRTLARLILPLSILTVCLLAATPAEARKNKWFVGGGIGLGFGDVDWIDLSGVVGYRVAPRVSTGVRLTYRARDDSRFERDVNTDDYGASLFARFVVKRPFFLQAEYEYLSYEFIRADLSTLREDFQSVLVGGGISYPIAPRVSLFATGLYNLTYESDELRSPYDSPWIFRTGVGFWF
jgi:hypothetical protein